MTTKYTSRVSFVLLFSAASSFGAVANLGVTFWQQFDKNKRVDPGAQVAWEIGVHNSGPDAADARLTVSLPPGARFVSINEAAWTCDGADATVVCTRHLGVTSFAGDFFDLTIAAADDARGSDGVVGLKIESDAIDPLPESNHDSARLTVYHTFTVTTPDDFGAGSLRDTIQRANEECDGALPCKIRFDAAMRIVPQAPLPAIRGCDVLVDGGVYDPSHYLRNRYFDQARRVEIAGNTAGATGGIVIASQCGTRAGGVELRGLAIGGFAGNGVDIQPSDHTITVDGCFIGTDATGSVAAPNGGRGIAASAPKASLDVRDSLIAGNGRSGVALYGIASAGLNGNLIGIRFGGLPMANGASGIYADSGTVRLGFNTIVYNHDMGVAVGPHAQHVASNSDYIVGNGGIAIDWLLDGPSPLPGLPPVPRLTDAFYDPATKSTIVRGVLPITIFTPKMFYAVRPILSAGDYQGGIATWPQTGLISTNRLDDIPFELRLRGDLTGQRIGAQSISYLFPDSEDSDASEFGAAIVVR
jgi:hypothetical protein